MTGLPFYEGFAPGRTRTMAACLASVEGEFGERQLRATDLVGDQVRDVESYCHGWRIRFCSGASLVIPAGVALDAAGNQVIEP